MSEKTLEDVYEAFALAIDAAGPEKETVLLAKVALLLAERFDDHDTTCRLIVEAGHDLAAFGEREES